MEAVNIITIIRRRKYDFISIQTYVCQGNQICGWLS